MGLPAGQQRVRGEEQNMTIPDKCQCPWCNDTMERRGVTQLGFGLNTFSLWCNNCGAVVIHIRHSKKRIERIETDVKYKD